MTRPFEFPLPDWLPWLATFFCMAFSARVAAAFLQKKPRLFTVMALFALSWALLLPYYVGNTTSRLDLLPAFNGVLCVYIGGLLILDHNLRDANKDNDHIVWVQNLALVLLCTIAAPSALQFSIPGGGHLSFITPERANMGLSLAIDALGFSVIAIGVRNICSRPVWWCFVLFTMLYFSIEASLDWEMWSAPAEAAISANYKFGFAACKVIYTLMLTGIVAAFGMPQADWEAGPLHWILRVAGVAPGRSAHAARRQSTAS